VIKRLLAYLKRVFGETKKFERSWPGFRAVILTDELKEAGLGHVLCDVRTYVSDGVVVAVVTKSADKTE